jgi:hypothetical protein
MRAPTKLKKTLVLNPPRLRPSACATWLPFLGCARRTGMGANDRAVQRQRLHVRVFGKMGVHSTLYPFVTPACEPLIHAELPYSSGSKRHWALLRVNHNTPSTNRQQSSSSPIYKSGHVCGKSTIFDHRSSGGFTFMRRNYAPSSPNVNTT